MISESRGIEKRSISGLSRLSIEIPTFVKWKFGIYLFRSNRDCPITYLLPCRGKSRESIGSRERISYGTGVIHTLYHHFIISISLIIIRTPQIIVLSVYLPFDVVTSSNLRIINLSLTQTSFATSYKPHQLSSALLLCAAKRKTETMVRAEQWADAAGAEVQVATIVLIVRICNPIEAVRRHDV